MRTRTDGTTLKGRELVQRGMRKLPKLDTSGDRVEPGRYLWLDRTHVGSVEQVRVYRRGSQLYVLPPKGVEVRVTAALAGRLDRVL